MVLPLENTQSLDRHLFNPAPSIVGAIIGLFPITVRDKLGIGPEQGYGYVDRHGHDWKGLELTGFPGFNFAALIRWLKRLIILLFSVPTALIIFWVWTLWWGERVVFRESVSACKWKGWENWVSYIC